jgi:hypothetical protein
MVSQASVSYVAATQTKVRYGNRGLHAIPSERYWIDSFA